MTSKEEIQLSLDIVFRTWMKNTEDLYDFDSLSKSSKNFRLSNSDKENFIITYKEKDLNEKNEISSLVQQRILRDKILKYSSTKIISILKYNSYSSNFGLLNSYKSKHMNFLYKPINCERIWKVFSKEKYSKISEGDVIKVGRIRIKFEEIHFNNNKKEKIENKNLSSFDEKNIIDEKKYKDESDFSIYEDIKTARNPEINIFDEKIYCRLCYQNNSDIFDPLLSPCKCSGSMKYIHLSCLKKSIKLKIKIKSKDQYDLYLFKGYNCEICLSNYPKYFLYKNTKYNLIDFDMSKYKDEYIICSLLHYDENYPNSKLSYLGFIIFKLDDKEKFTIGRKQNNQIILKDISISRNHCIILRENNQLFIKDLNSKFGTLLYINNYQEIEMEKPLQLVSGKHEFIFYLTKKKNIFDLSFFLNIWCCNYNQNAKDNGEFIMEEQRKNQNENDNSFNTLYFIQKEQMDYYKRFKDYDSYNDYIINLDSIIGVKENITDRFSIKKLCITSSDKFEEIEEG